jgi:hypothetical protein
MIKKFVYIAHPIGGSVAENLQKVKDIIRHINITMPDVLPLAHYVVECESLDDSVPEERQRGIINDIALLQAGFINEMWLYGPRISYGMKCEIEVAMANNISIFAKTTGTQTDLHEILASH